MSQTLKLALDRSMRRKDADGHLHVEMTNISKANVCPYYGREIPNSEALGLDPDRVYMLYRDPAELKAGAHTFDGKPLLMHHQPVTSDEHPTELVVGSIGTGARFDAPYLRAPLSVWRQDAIDRIEADPDDPMAQRELSCGYRYTADMTPGHTPEGVAFHGRMRNIMGNHVTIVTEGRAGADVVVADEQPRGLPAMRFPKVLAAIVAAIPGMSGAQAIALDTALDAELKGRKGRPEGDPDNDGDVHLSEDEKKTALDAYMKDTGKAMDSLTDEDRTEAYKRAAKDKKGPNAATEGRQPSAAMDQAAVDAKVAAAVAAATKDMIPVADADAAKKLAMDDARAEVHALYAARKAVESTVGVTALDSAEAVYRFALDHLKVAHKDIPAPELPALYEKSASAAAAPSIATDAAAAFDPSILGLSHIRKG